MLCVNYFYSKRGGGFVWNSHFPRINVNFVKLKKLLYIYSGNVSRPIHWNSGKKNWNTFTLKTFTQ